MLLAECQSDEVLREVPSSNGLRLRLCNTGEDDRYVNLPFGKTTIGSSPRCNIRIQAPGVQPLHCLMVREATGLSVRRWAAGTRLNGEPFDESTFCAGDRLTVGSVELVLENAQQEANPPQLMEDESIAESDESVTAKDYSATEDVPESGDVLGTPIVEQLGWDSKFEKLAEATSHLAQQRAALASDIAAVSERLMAAEQTIAHVAQKFNEPDEPSPWTTSRDELKRQQDELDRRVTSLEARFESQEHRLDSIQNELRSFEVARGTGLEGEQSPVATDESNRTPGTSLSPTVQSGSGVVDSQSGAPDATGHTNFGDGTVGREHALPRQEAASQSSAGDILALPQTLDDEIAPFAEFSIWKQGAASEPSPTVGSSTGCVTPPLKSAWDEESSPEQTKDGLPLTSSHAAVEEVTGASSPAAATASFIERYSHLFAEEGESTEPVPQPLPASPPSEMTRKPRNMDIVRQESSAPTAHVDADESIEQYMAKLLQRVRGESAATATTQVTKSEPLIASAPSTNTSESRTGELPELSPAGQPGQSSSPLPRPPVAVSNAEVLTSLGTVRRKAASIEDSADLETFRAVANESARRAISTHGLQTHRRNAVTKVIVCTLAGMTSLWLMLEAPNSHDLQFITACVSLMVAVYWTGQTVCELIEAFRAAAYDGPEDVLEGFADGVQADTSFDVNR